MHYLDFRVSRSVHLLPGECPGPKIETLPSDPMAFETAITDFFSKASTQHERKKGKFLYPNIQKRSIMDAIYLISIYFQGIIYDEENEKWVYAR